MFAGTYFSCRYLATSIKDVANLVDRDLLQPLRRVYILADSQLVNFVPLGRCICSIVFIIFCTACCGVIIVQVKVACVGSLFPRVSTALTSNVCCCPACQVVIANCSGISISSTRRTGFFCFMQVKGIDASGQQKSCPMLVICRE